MVEAPIPADEAERLASLYALKILDTPPEDRFDRITRLAQRLFDVPITYLALVDARRQWFKSKLGLDVQETPRHIAFCGHTILGDRLLIVPDAPRDVRFHDNPLVVGDPHVRFYAGFPLSSPDGRKVGTLCLVDRQPRDLEPWEVALLGDLAHIAESELGLIEVASLERQLVETKRQVEVRNVFIRRTFGRYLSDEVVESLLDSPTGLDLGGETRRVSLLMADLRGFSVLAAHLPANRVVRLLNNYLGTMAELVERHGGTVDEFIGDAILAIFGAPVRHEDDARRAVRCAVEMQRAMAAVNAWNRANDLPDIEMGIGIETGEAVVGNIGSERRAKYGVVGTPVNMAARMESYTLGGQVLISSSTLADAGAGVQVKATLHLQPKGSPDLLEAHDVAGIDGLEVPTAEAEVLRTLDPPRQVRVDRVRDKHAGGASFAGEIVEVGRSRCVLRLDQPLQPLENLRVVLLDPEAEALYARVLEPAGEGLWILRLTAVPPPTRARLEGA